MYSFPIARSPSSQCARICSFCRVLPILERHIEAVLFQCLKVPKYPACIVIVLLADPKVLSGLPPSDVGMVVRAPS